MKHTEDTKEKISNKLKGRKLSTETKERMSRARMGRKFSVESRRKMSESAKRAGTGKWGKGKKRPPFSEEWRKKLGRKGARNNLWKGGVSSINLKIRASQEYKLWREAIFKRDNYQCIWGGKEHGTRLEADHIKPFSLYPELRFAIDNGRTLCKDCHRKTDTFGNKLRFYKKL